ncbi:MAG TPA: ABC transporter ATP-binding protein [Candidatus Binatia bacterium]|nr:ABC transporter ATP-binding protein [Candidatus Binatia bacterium]
MIAITNLTKRYGDFVAVNSLDLNVAAGEILGFLGPNGAGKTTTIRMLMGLLQPTSGRVLLGGHDVQREPERAKALAGFIPDRPFIYEKLTGNEFLQFAGKLHHVESGQLRRRAGNLLERLDLTPWQDERIEGYSHGMKQRIVVCAALLHQPRIVIVDEPMVGMDPRGARTLKDLFCELAENGTAVFLSTHSISVAEEICHRIGIIQRGRLIACGSAADIRGRSQDRGGNLESAFLEMTLEQSAPEGVASGAAGQS